jgi:hypothetical protein
VCRASGHATPSTAATLSVAGDSQSTPSCSTRTTLDARNSEVFTNEWRNYLRRNPEDLQIIVTQDRIYLEKVH